MSGARSDTDLTDTFAALMTAPAPSWTFPEKLRQKTVLLVPGFLSNAMRPVYFADQKRFLRDLPGVEAYLVDIESEDPPAHNAARIRGAIRQADPEDEIVLVTHSKGSLDVLHLLIDYEHVRDRVSAWVSIQGALLGSPVADHVHGSPVLRAAAELTLRLLGGTIGSLDSLRTAGSASYIAEQVGSGALAAVLGAVRVLCFGSAVQGVTPLALSRDALDRRDIPNDGLMPLDNTFLPGARSVRVERGPDHAAPVMLGAPIDFDRERFTSALLEIAL